MGILNFSSTICLWNNTACISSELLALEVTRILTVVSVAVEVPATPTQLSLQKGRSWSVLIMGKMSYCAKYLFSNQRALLAVADKRNIPNPTLGKEHWLLEKK